jgi:hypothetical protein
VVNRGAVVQGLGEKVALAADLTGAATIAEGEPGVSEPQAEVEQAQPVSQPGVYKVQSTEGKELVGMVIPNLIDIDGSTLPLVMFTNGSQTAVQGDILGIQAGKAWDLPGGEPGTGAGVFYTSDASGVIRATIPIDLHGGSYSGPDEPNTKVMVGQTFDGRPVEVSVQPNIQDIVGTPDGRMLVPEHWKWSPLGLSETVSLATSEEDTNKEAAARRALASVTVRCGGNDSFSIDGFPVEKVAEAERHMISLDGAMFLLAGLGVEQGYGMQKLAEAYGGARPVQVRVGRYIHTADEQIELAKEAAIKSLAATPDLRRSLIKEAAVVPDPTAVDTILSLGFINPENIMTFVSYLPTIEGSQNKICELLLASRLGLNDVPTSALEKAVRSVEEVLEGLKVLAFQG